MKVEEVEQLTGVEGVKVVVEEVEEVNGANSGRKALSRFLMCFLSSMCLTGKSSPDSFEDCSVRSSSENSR